MVECHEDITGKVVELLRINAEAAQEVYELALIVSKDKES